MHTFLTLFKTDIITLVLQVASKHGKALVSKLLILNLKQLMNIIEQLLTPLQATFSNTQIPI